MTTADLAHELGHSAAAPAAPATATTARVRFPFDQRALADFRTGARYFGANRPHGRKHAGVDLIAPVGRPIHAIADGTVIQAPYYFYTGTNALEVHHPGVGTVRYGEINMHQVVRLRAGQQVRQGDLIAYVGRLDSGSSMLHFELYSGTGRGGLTVRSNPPYQRRSDLINPTTLMTRIQHEAFGI
jgi:murein DD-endopeptidase MepM/ murein hydrolase activator NlpD